MAAGRAPRRRNNRFAESPGRQHSDPLRTHRTTQRFGGTSLSVRKQPARLSSGSGESASERVRKKPGCRTASRDASCQRRFSSAGTSLAAASAPLSKEFHRAIGNHRMARSGSPAEDHSTGALGGFSSGTWRQTAKADRRRPSPFAEPICNRPRWRLNRF